MFCKKLDLLPAARNSVLLGQFIESVVSKDKAVVCTSINNELEIISYILDLLQTKENGNIKIDLLVHCYLQEDKT